ncbi:hypothetical protein R75471_00053 [Paraburkholderia domus]|uniref:hypothetical protein n=1 Tax=Paraburkholderia domus TaxID=2793075 RepID=UPI001B09C1DA|nr:hypothetical protein [Paraburkholderia domus]CAE6858773.1 hypothetical protein R75471_00053 [Paraburkholderia domus]
MKLFEDLTPTKFLGITGTVAAACIGATWLVAQKLQADELQGYKAAQELHLADAITSLKIYAESAKLTATEHEKLAVMEKQVPELIKTNADLKARIESVTRDRDTLQSTVNGILQKSAEVEIPVGEARSIVPNALTIGVVAVYGSSIAATVNGDDQNMKPGSATKLNIAGKPRTVTLTKISPNSATFALSKAD